MYILTNASGQKRYPKGTNRKSLGIMLSLSISTTVDFNPNAVMYAPHQYGQILISDIGIVIWLGALATWIARSGFLDVLRLYIVPYLWLVFLTPLLSFITLILMG